MQIRVILLFSLLNIAGGFSQILPGMAHDEIIRHMSDTFGDFYLVRPANPDEVDFIKYEHASGDMTLLVFMEGDICSFTRLLADSFYADDIIAGYNETFETAGEKKWVARERGGIFTIVMEESEWMVTITVREGDI